MAYDRKDKKKRPNGFIELIEYIKEEIKERKAEKIVMYAGIGAVIIIGATLVFTLGKKGGGKVKPDPKPVITIDDSTTGDSQEEKNLNPFEENAYPEINELINTYYKALEEYDADTYNQIVDSEKDMTVERLKKSGEFIEGYQNITIYTKKGLLDDSYIAFISFDIKFINIETLAPSLVQRYICKDDQGNVYIYDGDLDGEVNTYIQEMMESDDVKELSKDVDSRFNAAVASDQLLADLLQHFYNNAESPTVAENSTITDTSVSTEETTVPTTESSSASTVAAN